MKKIKENLGSAMRWCLIGVAFLWAVWYTFGQVRTFNLEMEKISQETAQMVILKGNPPKTRVVIDYGNGKTRSFEGMVAGRTELQKVFLGIEHAGRLSLSFGDNKITAVDGVRNSAKSWSYYINDVKQMGGVAEKQTKAGDLIVLKYE